MRYVLVFLAGAVLASSPFWSALGWLWHEGGLGCAFLDHDPNLASLVHGCRGICYRCGGPLLPAAPPTEET